MKTKLYALLILLALASACHDNDDSIPTDGDWFPLAVGNTWEYRYKASNVLDDFNGLKKEVTAVVQLEGKQYYQMVSTWKSLPNPYIDTVYYRIDDQGFVYQRRTTGEEGNPFRLNAADKESWKYSATSTENDMHVVYQEPVTITSTSISNTRLYYFDVPTWADEEWYTTLAPGIGIVTMSTAWTPAMDLTTAVINGKSYSF